MISVILSFASGLLTGLSFNLPSFSFLAWFSLVPFIYAINKKHVKTSIFLGITFSFAFYGSVLFWVVNVTGLGLVSLLLYLSFYWIIFSFFGCRLIEKPLSIIILPCLWVVLEFLKEAVWCGFGWANLGYSQYNNLYLIQIADLGGVKVISFLIMMVNILIVWIIFTNGLLGRVKRGIFIFFIFLACFLYSAYRLNSLEELDSIKVSVAQPNISQELKWDPSFSVKALGILGDLAKKSEEDTLVIFPEASWPLVVDEDNFYELEQFIKDINRDAVIGAVIEEKGKFYNAALLFDRKAKLIDIYRKIKLVPFGEYVPLRKFLSFINVLNSIGDMSRGDDLTKFIFKNKSFSVLICFEDIFPSHVLNFSRDNDFLINITNDAWFKGEPEAGQHLSIMTFRAIENRISIIRSANTGISGWVSFKGEIEKFRRDGKEVFFSGLKSFEVSLNKKRSFYSKHGDFFSFLCAVFLLGVFIKKKAKR